MPWWVIIYLTLVSMVIIGNILEQKRIACSSLYIVTSLCSNLMLVIGVLAYFDSQVSSALGKLLLPLLALSLGWGIYAARKDLQKLKPFGDLTASENQMLRKVAISISIAISFPGFLAGIYAGFRAW